MTEAQRQALEHLDALGYQMRPALRDAKVFICLHPNGKQVLLITAPTINFAFAVELTQSIGIQEHLDALSAYTRGPDLQVMQRLTDKVAELHFELSEASSRYDGADTRALLREAGYPEEEELRSTDNSPEVMEDIREAFLEWSEEHLPNVDHINHVWLVFENGQWWVKVYFSEEADNDERTFSVVDAEGGDSVDGFSFEEV